MLESFVFLLVVNTISIAHGEYDLMAFTLGQDKHMQLSNSTVIQFTKEITNYKTQDLANSVFTCRSPGLYKFQVYSLTRTDKALFLKLYHNDVIVASLWAHTPQDFAAAGNAVILDLSAGDTVQVKSRTNQTTDTYGTTMEIYTTFSGVQLGAYQSGTGSQQAAFSVAATQPQTVLLGAPVVYGKKYVDTENAFNLNTGTYVTPVGGIYYIHIFGLARLGKMLWLTLYHNDDYVCSIYGLTITERADAGNTVILHLKQGDRLQLRAWGADTEDSELYDQPDQIYTTFSGYELYPDSTLTSTRDGPKSYFSVGLTRTYTVYDGDKVKFDRVFTDFGSSYNHVTGEYVAPYFGVYEFNYHALAANTTKLALDLYHNYRYVNSIYSHTPIDFGAAGNSAVLELDAGDVVYIVADGTNHLFGQIDPDDLYCTFSGALLHSASAKHPLAIGK